MTEPTPQKVDPETLVLRARPKRVVRFKRHVLIGAAAVGCFALLGVTWLGLRIPIKASVAAQQTYDPDKAADSQKPKPDRLQALPKTYGDLPAGVPQLGPPLPGDLGKPLLEAREQQISSPVSSSDNTAANARTEPGLFFQVRDPGNSPAPAALASVGEPGLASAAPLKAALSVPGETDQNGQGHKVNFVAARSTESIYNPHTVQTPASPYQVMAGTVISASLITGLKSDLPGMVIAQVTAPVFDTVSGRVLLIPAGTRLIGDYDSQVSFGQSRALLIWKRLVMPDGSSLEIDNLPVTDTEGYAGLSDRLDYHTVSLLKGVGLSTLLGMAALGGGSDDSDLVKALRESARDTANQAGQKIVDKTLNIQPTLTVRPGWPLRVIVYKDLILKPYGA